MNRCLALLVLVVLPASLPAQAPQKNRDSTGIDIESDLFHWPAAERRKHLDFERVLNRVPDPKRIRGYHDLLACEPHPAGSPGDRRTAERLKKLFKELGLEASLHEVHVYLSHFKGAEVEIVAPVNETLCIREKALDEDPQTRHPGLGPGWNTYGATGEVTGQVVYVNYGTRTDFRELKKRGVVLKGNIAVARYGKLYRGYKVKYAEEAGVAGLLLYSDPADYGYGRGIMYPEGGYANPYYIQRGSIRTLPYPGDPLTPGVEATQSAERLDPGAVALPKIPVQPLGWDAAHRILSRMKGPAVPSGWQGGLPLAYRLTGGKDLRVRLHVEQERRITRTWNVIGILQGAVWPEQKVIVGCHHDAWGFGASDPLAGMIAEVEVIRSFAEAARKGRRPARTLVFAAWAAEEAGMVGSTEWVEAHGEDLRKNAVAYINLDMAAMGTSFRAGAVPSLRRIVAAASRAVVQPGGPEGQTVYDAWLARTKKPARAGEPRFGDVGGGSDHIGFYCHLGIPVVGLGGGGSRGVSYHSSYDTLAWYRKIVGDDYQAAAMVARVVNVLAARLACAPVVPLDPVRIARHMRTHLTSISRLGEAVGMTTSFESFDHHYGGTLERPATRPPSGISLEFGTLAATTVVFEKYARSVNDRLVKAVAGGRLKGARLDRVNALLMAMDRAWLHDPGLPGRPWYKNLYAATDEDSGYAAWTLPVLRHALKHQDRKALIEATELYSGVLRRLTGLLEKLEKEIEG